MDLKESLKLLSCGSLSVPEEECDDSDDDISLRCHVDELSLCNHDGGISIRIIDTDDDSRLSCLATVALLFVYFFARSC